MLNYGAPSWFYGEITEFAKADRCSPTPPGAMLRRPFCYRRSFVYAAVRVINYIAERNASWEKESGSVAKLWASNIRFCYCAILMLHKNASNHKCLLPVSTYCYETQHNQKLYTPSDRVAIGIRFTMSEAMTRSMQCPSIMMSIGIVIVDSPSSQCRRGIAILYGAP